MEYMQELPLQINIFLALLIAINPILLAIINRSQKKEISSVKKIANRAAISAAATEHEVKPNSGKSLADATNRTEVMVGGLSLKVDAMTDGLNIMARSLETLQKDLHQERGERARLDGRLEIAINERKSQITEIRGLLRNRD